MKALFYTSLLVATCLVVSMPALAMPVVDGHLEDGEYSNWFTAGWYNEHRELNGSRFKKSDDHTTTVYWENTGGSFYLYLEAPVAAKNMIWGAGVTDADRLSYYQHWCSPMGGGPAALDGTNCDHHDDGIDSTKFKLDFDQQTKSSKVTFAGFMADLGKGKDQFIDKKTQEPDTLYGKAVQEYKDSVGYVLNDPDLDCDTTDCDASDIPMAFEFKFAAFSSDSIFDLREDIKRDELEFHLSPERGAVPIPEPSAAVLFCVGALLVGNSIRRQPRAR